MTARAKPSDSLLCSEPGCCRRWVSNFGRRLCSEHDCGIAGHQPAQRHQASLASMPLSDALPSFNERAEPDDQEYVHDDRP